MALPQVRAVAFARVRWEGGVTDGTVINLCGGAFHVRKRLGFYEV